MRKGAVVRKTYQNNGLNTSQPATPDVSGCSRATGCSDVAATVSV